MFKNVTPESVGVKSKYIKEFITRINKRGLKMHSVVLCRGENIFGEYYWAPFDSETPHRMYSQTKSYVAVAIGLLIDEGKLSLDDKIVDFFPEKIVTPPSESMKKQTVRNMLMMSTVSYGRPWFGRGAVDRVELYFGGREGKTVRCPGTIWEYDSQGSQVLCCLVEKLAGMPIFDYLNEKIFKHLGTFKNATILKTPTGESWGDSAMLCTLRDMATFGNLVMHYGNHEGTQLVSESYLREATSPLVYNNTAGFYHVFHHGYGYQIWCTEQNGFAFVGMGDQLTVCLPERDFLFTMTADNQGNPAMRQLIINALFDIVVADMQDTPLPEAPEDAAALANILSHLTLRAMPYGVRSQFWDKISGKVFRAEDNGMGIVTLSLTLGEDTGVFSYENAQGQKHLPFGIGKNEFSRFPEFGYSDEFGGISGPDDFTYRCATSLGFAEEKKCLLRMQIIDRYLGNFTATLAFKDEDTVTVHIEKTAEHFLKEYNGEFTAHA